MPRNTAARCRAFAVSVVALVVLAGLSTSRMAAADPNLNGKLQVIHLDAAQGDGAVMITPGGTVVMFDDGNNTPNGAPNSCASVYAQLQALGITHVNLHFASHYHADHIGCITTFPGITIDEGWDRAQSYTTATYTNYANFLATGSRRRTLTKGKVFTLDSLSAHPVTITCIALAGDGITTSDENSKSVVLKVSYGEYDEEFGGDLPGYPSGTTSSNTNIESKVGPQVGKIEVYKVHHHGSAYASYDDWLNATTPKIGIISTGTGNTFGHPTAAALTRLHNHGVKTYWTETGQGVAPIPSVDKVANGPIRINAVWQAGGVDSIIANGIADYITNSDPIAPTVSLTTPDGGETVAAGLPTNIDWSASDNVAVTSVDLDYSIDGGANWNYIDSGVANSGSYSWLVPNTPSATARVRVKAHDGGGNVTTASSLSNFTIADQTAPLTQVVVPNGGETYSGGTTQTISWQASDNVSVSSFDVDYSPHGFAGPWQVVAHGLASAPDSLSWTVPNTPSDSAVVRVTAYDPAHNAGPDASDAYFVIGPNALGVGGAHGPTALEFYRPMPNPGHDQVTLRFALPLAGNARLDMIDVAGRHVWNHELGGLSAGEYSVRWDGRTSAGRIAPGGTYFVRLSTPSGMRVTRFVWLP